MNELLTTSQRWDLLRKYTHENHCGIPWDRMSLPQHNWFDNVETLGIIDSDFKVHKGKTIRVPRKLKELSKGEIEYLEKISRYREEDRKVREEKSNRDIS